MQVRPMRRWMLFGLCWRRNFSGYFVRHCAPRNDGQNVRLAAKLTGWRLDIQSTAGPKIAEATEDGEVKVEAVEEVKELIKEAESSPETPAAE